MGLGGVQAGELSRTLNNRTHTDIYAVQKLVVSVTSLSNVSIEFDLNGVDASIANAFRRILIAEVRPLV